MSRNVRLLAGLLILLLAGVFFPSISRGQAWDAGGGVTGITGGDPVTVTNPLTLTDAAAKVIISDSDTDTDADGDSAGIVLDASLAQPRITFSSATGNTMYIGVSANNIMAIQSGVRLLVPDEVFGLNDSDTGFNFPAMNRFWMMTAGVNRVKLNAVGSMGWVPGTLTLGVGVTTFAVNSNVMMITGDGGGNTLATITGAEDGALLTLIFVDGNITITDDNTHGADSIDLSAAFTSADDTVLQLVYDGTSFYEISRSTN